MLQGKAHEKTHRHDKLLTPFGGAFSALKIFSYIHHFQSDFWCKIAVLESCIVLPGLSTAIFCLESSQKLFAGTT